MSVNETNQSDEALALSALVWTLGENGRADRLLALTGLTPSGLRARIGDPFVLAACLRFLEAHEPDLIACSKALEIDPKRLVEARARLEQ